jgi:heme/copper-type cytochrome/quinol oxidase subunit 2
MSRAHRRAVPSHPGELRSPRRNLPTTQRLSRGGEPVVLLLHSIDVTHGLKIADFNINSEDIKKARTELQFSPQQTGHYVGHCAHFWGKGHGAMKLQIDVVP